MPRVFRLLPLLLPLVLAACGPLFPSSADSPTQRGKALYGKHCAACHGADAWGAGTASLGLGAPPPDLTTLSSRNGGRFPTDYVIATIAGKARAADPDAAMPLFGEEAETVADDAATAPPSSPAGPRPEEFAAISAYLETLQVR